MASDTLSRNTIFALIIAVEQDLRSLFIEHLQGQPSPLKEDEMVRVYGRVPKERGASASTPWLNLLDYFELSQTIQVLKHYEEALATALGTTRKTLKELRLLLSPLSSIRNRVCHGRELEPSDLTVAVDQAQHLARGKFQVRFGELENVMAKLNNHDYLLALTIPDYWKNDLRLIENNLPDPDFEVTGFIGRQTDIDNLKSLLLGPPPVITVTGEGGLGKTSLTLRCLQDIIQRVSLFDYVVWTSLKTTHLTPSGVREVADAMTNEVQLLAAVADVFGLTPGTSVDDLFEAVHQILATFRVLLVIDNLETIDRDALRPLLINIPRQSKVVITSRVGIGEIEVRYQLQPMKPAEASDLLRKMARGQNVGELGQRTDPEVEQICDKLFFNPLAIRWFVQSYAAGRSIQDLLDKQRSLDDVMDFCFKNLYETLHDRQKKYLRTIVAVGKPLSEVQIALLSEVGDIEQVRTDLRFLSSSNLLRRLNDDWEGSQSQLWSLTDFAHKFVLTHDKNLGHKLQLRTRHRKLMEARDAARMEANVNQFNDRVVHANSTDQAMVGSTLKDAMDAMRAGDYDSALGKVATASGLLPDFHEVWRVSAQIKNKDGDAFGAQEDFEKALQLAEGKSEPLLVQYAEFLLRQQEFDYAVDIIEEAAQKPDASPQLVAKLAWVETLRRNIAPAIELFERAQADYAGLNGLERTIFLTQYAESLKSAAEDEAKRHLPDNALIYIYRSLELVLQACREELLDKGVVQTGQACFDELCGLLALRGSRNSWEHAQPLVSELATHFALRGTKSYGFFSLRNRCSEIFEREDFQEVISPRREVASTGEERALLLGTIARTVQERGFGFIFGDDGREYFFHYSDLRGVSWTDLCQLDQPRVQFVLGSDQEGGRGPSAVQVSLHKRGG